MPVPVIYDVPGHPVYHLVQEAILRANRITVLCGAGVSTSAGIKVGASNSTLWLETLS